MFNNYDIALYMLFIALIRISGIREYFFNKFPKYVTVKMSFIQWKKCWTEPKQLLKLIILLLCVCFSLYQFADCVNKLLHPPMSTHAKFYLNESMRYPSLTICRRPAYKNILFPKYGLRTSTNLESVRAFQNFYFDIFTIQEFLEDVTYTFDEIFKSYAYAGTGNSPQSPAPIQISEFYTIGYGRCYTLTAKSLSSIFSVSGGYFLYFQHDVTTKVKDAFGISESGFRIFLHDDNEILTSAAEQNSSFLEYLYLETSEDMIITLGVQEFSQISSNDAPCVYDDPCYSKSRCLEQCLHKQIVTHVGCTLPWMYLYENHNYSQCSNTTTVQEVLTGFLTNNRNTYIENCSCLKTCNITVYSPHVINRREMEPKNFSQIAIYYTANLVTKMSEIVTYNWNSFLSDIGGSLGFLLGLSVIGFIGIVEEICQIIFRRWFKSKGVDNTNDSKNNLNEKISEDIDFNPNNFARAEDKFIFTKNDTKPNNKY